MRPSSIGLYSRAVRACWMAALTRSSCRPSCSASPAMRSCRQHEEAQQQSRQQQHETLLRGSTHCVHASSSSTRHCCEAAHTLCACQQQHSTRHCCCEVRVSLPCHTSCQHAHLLEPVERSLQHLAGCSRQRGAAAVIRAAATHSHTRWLAPCAAACTPGCCHVQLLVCQAGVSCCLGHDDCWGRTRLDDRSSCRCGRWPLTGTTRSDCWCCWWCWQGIKPACGV